MENVKREQVACDCSKVSEESVDRITKLPTEVLGLIFSFLSFKEAAAKGLVCPRWKNLWTLTPNLDFDGSDSVIEKADNTRFPHKESVLIEERRKFVGRVDAVITTRQNSKLEGFRVFSDLSSDHTETINKWVAYAFNNNVESLDLSFVDCTGIRTNYNHHLCYDFPFNSNMSTKNLKQLSLHSVNVTGEALEFLVSKSNSPLLERLSISLSQVLTGSLEINRPSPSLKSLEICLCHNLTSVVVRDSELVTIKYYGMSRTSFVLHNVPLLTQLWIGGYVTRCMDEVALMFASVFQHLQSLNVHFLSTMLYDEGNAKMNFEMRNLKQLVVSFPHPYEDEYSLMPLIKLISACPFLERFVVELPHNKRVTIEREREIREMIDIKHLNLKEVEFVGYRGVITQLELLMHFVDNAVVLQNIIVDPCTFNLTMRRPWHRIPLHELDDEMFARARAEDQLKRIVPSKIALEIL